jgi:hypothetical protein
MDELATARQARDDAFNQFMKHAALETKHSVSARKFRNLYRLASDEVRELERDLLSFPIIK